MAGTCAAAATLTACLVLSLIGWFLADGGVHGAPVTRCGPAAWPG